MGKRTASRREKSNAPAGHVVRETVLVALCGRSPAVVTETVWALSRETPAVVPRRVVVLTTLPGRDDIRRELLEGAVWDRLREIVHAPDDLLCFGDSGDAIRVFPSGDRTRELDDIAGTVDSEAAADFILESLRQFTENPDCRVVVSIAGGRKTMSVLAGLCLTLLGRRQDRLCHVLVNPPFDSPTLLPRFYFPDLAVDRYHLPDGTEVSAEEARVTLCEIPYVRFRYLYHDRHDRYPGTFAATVDLANDHIAQLAEPATLYLAPGEHNKAVCRVGRIQVRLNAAEFALYWMLAERQLKGEPWVYGQDRLVKAFSAFADGISREVMPEIINHNRFVTKRNEEDMRKLVSSLTRKLRKALGEGAYAQPFMPGRERGVYGIGLSAEHIAVDVN